MIMRRVPIYDARKVSRRHIPRQQSTERITPLALVIVLERYYRELLNFLSRTVNDRDAAADLAQESYARVLALRQSGQAIANARALLYRTARNLVIDRHRRGQFRAHEDLDAQDDAAEGAAAPRHEQPEEAYAHAQHARALAAAIEALPPRCREAFVLNRFEGLSHQEVAERMGISKNMVAQHIIRGVLACQACEDALDAAGKRAARNE